jgi:hypothetical protein
VNQRLVTIVLSIGLVFAALMFVPRALAWRLPGNNQGYEPAQPIAFSHRLHAGEMQVACLYCHADAETSRHAGIPAASVCMNCHRFVTATPEAIGLEDERARKENRSPRRIVSPELLKVYDALALDADLQVDRTRQAIPIVWTKVHNVPDFVYFDHRAHLTAGVPCRKCHGPIETMERMRQVETLGMGWCVNCHRQATATGVGGKPVRASVDCVTCHY